MVTVCWSRPRSMHIKHRWWRLFTRLSTVVIYALLTLSMSNSQWKTGTYLGAFVCCANVQADWVTIGQWGVCCYKNASSMCHVTLVRLVVLRQLDAVGVVARQHQRMRRTTYYSHGPNDIWHVDGCDKLRPYGILISRYDIIHSMCPF